jgi:hypothetical protein
LIRSRACVDGTAIAVIDCWMSVVRAEVALIAASLVAGCDLEQAGLELASTDHPILYGQDEPGDPAVGRFLDGGKACTATLISSRLAITAAHCLPANPNADTENMFLAWGPSDEARVGTSEIAEFVVHRAADVGIVVLTAPGPAQPVLLNRANLGAYIGDPVRLVGYGVTSTSDQTTSGIKRSGVSRLEYLDVAAGRGSMLFTGAVGAKTCDGDSGGPAFMRIGDYEMLAGVTSFGTNDFCEQATTYDGAVRADIYFPWIAQHAAQYDPDSFGCNTTVDCEAGLEGDLSSVSGCRVSGHGSAPGSAGWLVGVCWLWRVRRRRCAGSARPD